jgi:hypothetical protein
MLGAARKDVQCHRPALAMSTVAESTVQTHAASAGVSGGGGVSSALGRVNV